MPLGMEVGLGLRDIVFDVDPANPRKKGTPTPTQFLAHVYCGQMAGWMKTPLRTEVDLGPGHTILDGVPAPAKGAQHCSPLFSAHVYCGHGRPSQLLLSSCYIFSPVILKPRVNQLSIRTLTITLQCLVKSTVSLFIHYRLTDDWDGCGSRRKSVTDDYLIHAQRQ